MTGRRRARAAGIDNGAGTAIATTAGRVGKSIAKLEERFPAVEIAADEPRAFPAFECASWNQAGKEDWRKEYSFPLFSFLRYFEAAQRTVKTGHTARWLKGRKEDGRKENGNAGLTILPG